MFVDYSNQCVLFPILFQGYLYVKVDHLEINQLEVGEFTEMTSKLSNAIN